MRQITKQVLRKPTSFNPFLLSRFAADRMSSEMLSQYFINRNIPEDEDEASPREQQDLRKLKEIEIRGRLDKIQKTTVGCVFCPETHQSSSRLG